MVMPSILNITIIQLISDFDMVIRLEEEIKIDAKLLLYTWPRQPFRFDYQR